MGQYDRTPANPFIQNYIARYADVFQSYAANLGLPPTAALAAASAISEEMRGVYGPTGIKNVLFDAPLDLVNGAYNDQQYANSFSSSLPKILARRMG